MKKVLSLLLSFAFLSSLAFARQDSIYEINDFSSGMNSHASPYVLKPGTASDARNVRFNRSFGTLSKRPVANSYGSVGSHSVTSLHRYYKSDATKKLLSTGSTKLYVGDDSAGTFQTLKTGLTDGKRFQWVTYKDVAIGANGFDNAIKYDGHTLVTANTDAARTAEDVVAELGAPFAELNTGSNLDASSWYIYKVAFYNGSTYSYSTARSNPINTGSSVRDVTLTDIPLGPAGTTTRYIYRTSGNASKANVLASSTYYLVDDIADNTTRTFNDTIDDTTLEADAAPTWATVSAGNNATPPQGTIITIHRERAWISGNQTYPSEIYWSDEFNPDYFDPADYDKIREDDGDEITAVKEQLGVLRIFKTNSVQSYYTEANEGDWYSSPVLTPIGTSSPYSVSNSPQGIFYLGNGGIYLFNGQSSTLVSDAITPEIRDILSTSIPFCYGIWFNNVYQLAYASSESGSTINNRVLYYNTIRNAWSVDTKEVNCFVSLSSGSDEPIVYTGSSDSDGNITSEEIAPPEILKRLKSEFDAGTYDDTANYGTELLPTIELAWDLSIDNMVGTIDASSGIIDRPDTTGTWTSPVYQINATELGLLYWNEQLNLFGDVTFAVRLALTEAGVSGASWSSEFSDPNGSDISGVTANSYVQFRISLSTSDITITPRLSVLDGYLFRMTFSKTGTVSETSVLSVWAGGWTDFGAKGVRKLIQRIKVFYTGTSGTLNIAFDNDEHDAAQDFDIDLSQNPSTNPKSFGEDNYIGDNTNKIYVYYPEGASATTNAPIGNQFQFVITENGATSWSIQKIEVVSTPQPMTD